MFKKNNTLKPCSACGSKDPVAFKKNYAIFFKWQCYCCECGASSLAMPTKATAVWAWNWMK